MAKEEDVTISVTLSEDQAWALAQMCKRFGRYHAEMLSDASDGGLERDQMLDAIIRLARALREKGLAPR